MSNVNHCGKHMGGVHLSMILNTEFVNKITILNCVSCKLPVYPRAKSTHT